MKNVINFKFRLSIHKSLILEWGFGGNAKGATVFVATFPQGFKDLHPYGSSLFAKTAHKVLPSPQGELINLNNQLSITRESNS